MQAGGSGAAPLNNRTNVVAPLNNRTNVVAPPLSRIQVPLSEGQMAALEQWANAE